MDNTFKAILNKHEFEDEAQTSKDSLFLSAIKKEFVNSEEILNAINSTHISIRDFLLGKVTTLPIVPIRNSDDFYIKKHTQYQVPYFHSHNFYELIYVRKGHCLQKLSDGVELHLSEKQCSIIPPDTAHSIEKCRQTDIILKMVIPRKIIAQLGKAILKDLISNEVRVFTDVSETAEIAIFKLLKEQYCTNKFKDLLLQSYLTILFAELVNSSKSHIVWETLLYRYFEKNIKTASLEDFAAIQNYNQNYVSRLIKNLTGKSFSELLCNYRINRAKELLIESSLSVEEIAFIVGYSNASSLYKQFFATLGMKPSEYRKLYK